MLTKSHIKLIASLSQKKFRTQHQLFIVEGLKGIKEFLNSSFELHQLFSVENVFNVEAILVSNQELKKISSLKTPNTALAIFKMPKLKPINENVLVVALDNVRDPGNLGTIIRLCDWFGIKDLVCNSATVDCYNPKVVQATMGSLSRVNISYLDLPQFLKEIKVETFGTFMNGKNIYIQNLPKQGVIILGNEANGISESVEAVIDKRISIPRFGDTQATESLNVATATAIALSEFKRGFTEM
ncbi:TrmH family RNA methyltransferase [Ichthyenterobacterium magnum]|nr:RNA methyltransferase [Ichthyenterobacterium magnum]